MLARTLKQEASADDVAPEELQEDLRHILRSERGGRNLADCPYVDNDSDSVCVRDSGSLSGVCHK